MNNSEIRSRLEQLDPAKRARLLQLAHERASRMEAGSAIPVRNAGPAGLSYAQQRLWFLSELAPGDPVYNIPGWVRIRGPLSIGALAQSLQEIVRRHGALRTRFGVEDREPVQIVEPEGGIVLEVTDLRRVEPGRREEAAEALGRAAAGRGFDLSRGPLLRTRLLLLDEREYLVLITLHHIIADGWSHALLVKELSALYGKFSRGEASELPELEIQYADYAVWQRDWLKGEVYQKQLSYWKDQLQDLEALQLPTDHARPARRSFQGGCEETQIEGELTRRLRELARREGVTLYMVLLAGFAALLQRYSQQREIVIGTPIANRGRKEIEGLIGFFVNSLVLRLNIDGRMGRRDLLKHVKQVCLGAYGNQDLPFEKLVDELQPERDLSRNPLFQVMFVMTNLQDQTLVLGEARTISMVRKTNTAKFDLQVTVKDTHGKLELITEYSTDLYEGGTIGRLVKHYVKLLGSMVEEANRGVGEWELLEGEEWRRWEDWNRTATGYGPARCIHELISEQAIMRPDAVAVVFGEQALSYAELNRRSNQLAHWLGGRGVGPEQVVGVGLARSLELVVCLLGVMKAGAGYAPLDPEYPGERLRAMVEDAGAGLAIVGPEFGAGDLGSAEVWRWEVLEREVRQCSAASPGVRMDGQNLMYVIFTSGSTGAPKGAMNTHAGLFNRLLWMQQEYRLTPADRILQKTPFSFDVSGWEFHWPLMFGACLEVAEPWGHHDPEYLARHIQERGITTLHFVPSMFEFFLGEPGARRCESLQRVICSGEALSAELAQRHYEVLPAQLHNLYGPTEAAIDVTYWACERDWKEAVIPIGRPIANTEIWILDSQRKLCPVGAPGEIWIGGAGLARGYAGRADWTAERFAPHAIAGHVGERLYCTGDVGVLRADGQVRYLGRVDTQVKIRGLRIELGEIEALLNQHPGVVQSAVTAQEGARGLTAYVAPRLEAAVWAEAGSGASAEAEQVSQWQVVFEENYSHPERASDYRFDLAGWESSYTGLPLGEEEMRDWVEEAAANISEWKAERILEIGCGTGLLLWRLAPGCREYLGTDFSGQAVEGLRRHLQSAGWSQAQVQRQEANDFAGLGQGRWDAVVLNSVAQYFPHLEYLLQVIEGSLEALGEQGRIYLGDIRSLPLLGCFMASVEVSRSGVAAGRERLRENVQRRLSQEEELVIAPAFFVALKKRFQSIARVEVRPRRSRFSNELTSYRYDVVLHKDVTGRRREDRDAAGVQWLDWEPHRITLAELGRRSAGLPAGGALGIRGIQNRRLQWDLHVQRWLESQDAPERPEESFGGPLGIDPAELWELGEASGRRVALSWAASYADGSFDAIISRGQEREFRFPEKETQDGAWTQYANQPLRGRLAPRIASELRRYLSERLPQYMTPGSYVVMERLPVNRNGKLDRRALAAPPKETRQYVEPASEVEKILTGIWREVLERERIGTEDNFFEIGGNSLLATQVMSRARAVFRREIPLRRIFETPTVKGLGQWIGERLQAAPRAAAGPKRDASGRAEKPLSYAQQRLWFLAQFAPGHAYYNMPGAVRIRGALSVTALEQSLREIVRRHETLRTHFQVSGEGPVQVIEPEPALELEITDLRHLETAVERRKASMELSRREARRGFDLASGPLLRARLLRLAESEYVLLLTMHHIVSDGWSHQILLREERELYERFAAGMPSALAELTLQYGDYAIWQRQWIEGEVYQQQLRYWREQLQGMESLQLPADYPRPAVQRFRGGIEQITIDEDLTARLRELARREGVTLYMILLAAFAVLLQRYSGQSEVVTGTPIANRNLSEIEGLIGFFVNTLVLRIQAHEEMTWRELIRHVRQVCLGAYANQDLPFEKLVEALHPDRDVGKNPIVQVLFVMVDKASGDRQFSNIEFSDLIQDTGTAKFDLQCFVQAAEREFRIFLEYSTDLYRKERITRALQDYASILRQAATNPSLFVGGVRLLTEVERASMLTRSLDANETPDANLNLHDIIEDYVRFHGDTVAICSGRDSVTWGELQRQAKWLGGRIAAAGANFEDVVGIYLQDNLKRLIAVLAVIEAGAAYLVLNADEPIESTVAILKNSSGRYLVTEAGLAEDARRIAPWIALIADAERDEPNPHNRLQPRRRPDPSNLCRVAARIAASASLEYCAMRDLVSCWRTLSRAAAVSRRSCLILSGSAVEQALLMLFAYGSVVLAPPECERDAGQLAQLIRRERIEHLSIAAKLAKPLLRQLAALERPEDASLTDIIFIGVEPVIDAEAWSWLQKRGCAIWNLYGTDESPVLIGFEISSDAQGNQSRKHARSSVIANRTCVLGRGCEPARPGGMGELCVRGRAVARGYASRPELTAECFIPDPLSVGGRLFRTGDVARFTTEQSVERIGRASDIVNVRGNRVSLEDVDARIRRHPSVHNAAVLPTDSEPERVDLIAFIEARPGATVTIEELREHLRDSMASYTLPVKAVNVREIPLLPNGTVDRDKVRSLGGAQDGQRRLPHPDAPQTPTERQIKKIFTEVLGITDMGPTDDFFELGGHSLMAVRVVSRLKSDFGTRMTLRDFFAAPTVRLIAERLDEDVLAQSDVENIENLLALVNELPEEIQPR